MSEKLISGGRSSSKTSEYANSPRKRVEFPAEGITCDLYTRSVDREMKRATYEIVVSNDSDSDITCRLCGRDASAHALIYGVVPVGKRSQGSSLLSVPLHAEDDPQLFVQALGDGIDVFSEATKPAAKHAIPLIASLLFFTLLAIAAISVGYVFERPVTAALGMTHPAASPAARVAVAVPVAVQRRVPRRHAVAPRTVFVSASQIGMRPGKFSYLGRWEGVTNPGAGRLFGVSRRTSMRGASVTFPFVGHVVSIYGVRGPGGGHGLLTIDRNPPVRVNFYASKKISRAVVFHSPKLGRGKHVLRIVASGDVQRRSYRSSFINIAGAAYK